MPDATFACPDLTTFARLDDLGLEVVGQRLEPDRAVLACRVLEPDQWWRRCGCEGVARDTVIRRLAHEPLGWRPTVLLVTIRRYRCTGCGAGVEPTLMDTALAHVQSMSNCVVAGTSSCRMQVPRAHSRKEVST